MHTKASPPISDQLKVTKKVKKKAKKEKKRKVIKENKTNKKDEMVVLLQRELMLLKLQRAKKTTQ